MDERMKFVGRLLSGEKMAPLCKEFGISRVTGHKIWNRYQQDGSRGLYNRSRAPHKHPNQVPYEIEQLIVRFKKEKPDNQTARDQYGSLHFRSPRLGSPSQTREQVSHPGRLPLNAQRTQ